MSKDEKDIVWLGDSLEVLCSFPKSIRIDLGSDLRRLQKGELPLDSKPLKTVGPGVRELRARDRNKQFRTIYVLRTGTSIVVVHCFVKKSRNTPKTEVDLARERLRAFDRG